MLRDPLMNAGGAAGALAGAGPERRALSTIAPAGAGFVGEAPLLRLACRDAVAAVADEQLLVDHIARICELAGCPYPRWLIVNYHVSLKTNPLVILAGAEGTGKADFSRLYAAALVGAGSPQYAHIPGRAIWHTATGEGTYFRSVHERFTSLRFLELLQEAAQPANAGRLYLVSFQRLHPAEVEPVLTAMLGVLPGGQRRLRVPGAPAERQIVIPPNVRISATVDTGDDQGALSSAALAHAGVIDFADPAPGRAGPLDGVAALPPGYQRLWLRAAVGDVARARERLTAILGAEHLSQLTASPAVKQAIWGAGLALSGQMLQELTLAVANSFDVHGVGLFDRADRVRNAQIAYDTQLIQRVRWRLSAASCPTVADYFAALGPGIPRRAVA